jgi:hypothetical protein
MYKVHQQAKMVPATLTTTNIQNVPIITASASVDSTGKLHISMCNTHATSTHTVAISLNNAPAYTTCTGTIINGPSYNSYNNFDVAEAVNIQNFAGATMSGTTVSVAMPAHSVVTLELTPSVGALEHPVNGSASSYEISNTANGQIAVKYAVTEKTPFTLGLYTIDGRMVVETFKGIFEPGQKAFVWQPKHLGKGTNVYIVKMKSEGVSKSARVLCQR